MKQAVKKKKKRKIRYAEFTFKLSSKQKKLFLKCCKLNRTSPNKFVRLIINNYLEQYADQLKEDKSIHKNQLKLFSHQTPPPKGTQLQIKMD